MTLPEALNKTGTEETPGINLNAEQGLFEISGRSLPENALEFYQDIIRWMDEYISSGSTNIKSFNFSFEYFNSSSAKQILMLLTKIKQLSAKQPGIAINWYYQQDDTDIKDSGEKYHRLIDFPINLIAQ